MTDALTDLPDDGALNIRGRGLMSLFKGAANLLTRINARNDEAGFDFVNEKGWVRPPCINPISSIKFRMLFGSLAEWLVD
ncbi:MAG: hypothetical protein R2813_07185 [Flavobacteriales bacterium]